LIKRGRPGRNDPCPCGSGRKVKQCHQDIRLGPADEPLLPVSASLWERNTNFLESLAEILHWDRLSWDDVKRRVTPAAVREIYLARRRAWDGFTNEHLRVEEGTLRGVYLGDIDPSMLAQRVFRFGLYVDEIMVVDPFHLPSMPGRSPLEQPEIYLSDTLKALNFMRYTARWIRAGYLTLVPNPAGLDRAMWEAGLANGDAQSRRMDPADAREEQDDLRALLTAEQNRQLASMPRDVLWRHVRSTREHLADADVDLVVDELRRLNAADPLALPFNVDVGQLWVTRGGTSHEASTFLCDRLGAFPFTYSKVRWRELERSRESSSTSDIERTWSPLTRGFQELDFKFLNNVDYGFAASLREQERLHSFRSYLGKVFSAARAQPGVSTSEAVAREFGEELKDEYRKAEEEWAGIDREIVKWSFTGFVGGGAPIIAGGFGLSVALVTALVTSAGAAASQLYGSRGARRKFKVTSPMSVLVDLSRHRPRAD
jgi:hypothetical protein